MKKYILGLSIAASSLSLSSCLGDLDTVPLNETDYNDELKLFGEAK